MRIGELSRRTGATQRALRYYESCGLLEPARGLNGYREYAESDIGQVARIRALLAAGVPSHDLVDILPCVDPDAEEIVITCPDFRGRLQALRRRMDDQQQELRTSLQRLDAVLGRSEHGTAQPS